MERARLREAESIFNDLIGLSEEARAPELNRRCHGDFDLRRLVEQLISNDDSGMAGFLQMPAFFPSDDLSPPDALHAPKSIGNYEIVRCIGEGGMGVVYEARQANPRRTVALKVLRSTLPSPSMLARFQHEAHVLAQLQHPGIAHIYEAAIANVSLAEGVTASQPYFAMELIEGLPLRTFADHRGLNVRQRLELMVRVCNAVQHAHEKGVIHRDLKPDNILVEASGLPRVLDFGVARLTDPDSDAETLHTRAGEIVGTLAFMSPEQLAGDKSRVDTRSDVYSLGVILYELLTGSLPQDVKALSFVAAARRVQEDDPRPPSDHDGRLRGEADWIVMKSLEKEPVRRYSSAGALAEDIQRFLQNEPVLAGKATRAYLLKKLVQRNKSAVAVALTVMILLVAAVVGTSYGLVQAREQRNAAEAARVVAQQEEATANAVVHFLSRDLLGGNDPLRSPGNRDDKLSDVIARAETRIESGAMADHPAIEARIRNVVGHLHLQLGQLNDAERQFRRALELDPLDSAADRAWRLETLINLGQTEHSLGQLDEATKIYRQASELSNDLRDVPAPLKVTLLNNQAELLRSRGELNAAEHIYRAALDVPNAANSDQPGMRGVILSNIGELQRTRGEFDRAIATADQSLDLLRAAYGNEHATIATVLSNKGLALKLRGDLPAAEVLYRQALAMRRKLLPPTHVDIAQSLNNLASLLRDRGQFAEAETLYREGLGIAIKALPPGHFQIGFLHKNVGNCLVKLNRFAEAETELKAAYEIISKAPGLPPQLVHQTAEAFVILYDTWAKADPAAGLEAKAAEWRAKMSPGSETRPAQ
jgi:tetratricopeptide (TPR) repeat protein